MDVDELIVPQVHENWNVMLEAVTSHDDVIGGNFDAVSFRMAFVFRNKRGSANEGKYDLKLENKWRSTTILSFGEIL